MLERKTIPAILTAIDLDKLIDELVAPIEDKPKQEQFKLECKALIENCYRSNLQRKNNFCIDLANASVESWSKEKRALFGNLLVSFSDAAERYLIEKQKQGQDIEADAQFLYVQLPVRNELNKRNVNSLQKTLLNHGYEDRTGNESRITLLRTLNPEKTNVITPYSKVKASISLVMVTEESKALLLQRAGQSGRRGAWGTLTGEIEPGESVIEAAKREAEEETGLLLKDKIFRYIESFHVDNFGEDLFDQGLAVSFARDCSYLIAVVVPEAEIRKNIKLNSENADWGLFDRKQITELFKGRRPVEGHVTEEKVLLVLSHAEKNFRKVVEGTFNFGHTNSRGFFAKRMSKADEVETSVPAPERNKRNGL